MLLSLALIFLVGLSVAEIVRRIGLPRIVGMIATGIVLGPFALDLLDPSILGISTELRRIALVVILIRAGLSLNLADLKKVGRPAVLLSFLPACFEILGYFCFAPLFLGVAPIDAALMGAVLSAVSPAVVVPRMIKLIETGRGTKKAIPQMILAGASCDDVFVIVLFGTFLTMAQGGSAEWSDFLKISVSIVLGVLLGIVAAIVLYIALRLIEKARDAARDTFITLLILSTAFLLTYAETALESAVAVSGLLAVIAMACVLKTKLNESTLKAQSEKFGALWVAAEVLLFVLVGAAVDVRYTLEAGLPALGLILTALLFRAVGVLLSLLKTELGRKERLFCVIAYLPKATVQAAIGSIPLSLGLPCGKAILSVAVLAILITAPLGAIGIDRGAPRLLPEERSN
ncbi:MAG: cation:proton antiporter [Bacteroides sp.]|nr:cation:proton antiporter [Eubacterium sp.]MCM1418377.1 cation:proton antiporter [Roseburia sp.]MCM1462478.1 cation:proton antiporter [Bacteroides sp.]